MDGMNVERMVDADGEWEKFPYHTAMLACNGRGCQVIAGWGLKFVTNSNAVWVNKDSSLYTWIQEDLKRSQANAAEVNKIFGTEQQTEQLYSMPMPQTFEDLVGADEAAQYLSEVVRDFDKACECGAEKCGSNIHSTWCPKA